MIKLFEYCLQHSSVRVAARRVMGTVFTLVTAYFLLCTVINWYGATRLKAVLALITAQGETVDIRALLPSPINESENFCAIEPLRDLAMDPKREGLPQEKRKRLEALKLPQSNDGKRRPALPNPYSGQRTDLGAFNEWTRINGWTFAPENQGNPAADLLKALGKQDALFEELSRGLEREKANWTPEWTTRELPRLLTTLTPRHLSAILSLNSVLALRAGAAAQTSDNLRAKQSALIMSRLALASSHDPFLISALVTFSLTQQLCGAVWELCDAQTGTAEDFSALEASLAELDPNRVILTGVRTEVPILLNDVRYAKTMSADFVRLIFGERFHWWQLLLIHSLPIGIFDANAAVAAELELKHIIRPLRDDGMKAALQTWERVDASLQTGGNVWTSPIHILARMITPSFRSVLRSAVWTKVIVEQARIACALERHRIETGGYPESLESIKMGDGSAPPLDVMSGKPMLYRKIPGGRYAVWSIGFDCEDNDGKRGLNGDTSQPAEPKKEGYQGDWVWDFPQR